MIFIVTGPVHSGKTTLLKNIIFEFKKHKFKIEGFLSEVVLEGREIVGYDLFEIKGEKSIPFIRKKGQNDWQKIGSYFFIPQSLIRAEEIIQCGTEADICVIDEVGPLELIGKGLWPALKRVVFLPLTRYLLVVRENILEDFLEVLKATQVKVFHMENKEIFSRMIEEIGKAAR